MNTTQQLFQHSRKQLLAAVKGLSEENAHIIPPFARNTIHWNIGHLIVSLDNRLFKGLALKSLITENWYESFVRGTFPKEQISEMPPFAEVIDTFAQQIEVVINIPEVDLLRDFAEPVEIVGTTLSNAAELLQFMVWHESLHTGIVSTYVKYLEHTHETRA
ncbi:MAG: DinB family protein [Bacilli bacterium]